jgi:hypothetical protein
MFGINVQKTEIPLDPNSIKLYSYAVKSLFFRSDCFPLLVLATDGVVPFKASNALRKLYDLLCVPI